MKIFLCNGRVLQETYKVGFYDPRCYILYLLNESLIKTFPKPKTKNFIDVFKGWGCIQADTVSICISFDKYFSNTWLKVTLFM